MPQPAKVTKRPSKISPLWRPTILAIFLALIFGLALYFALQPNALGDLSDAFTRWVRDAGPLGWLLIIALMIAHSFVPVPAEFVAIAAGVSYQTILGSILVWIGAMGGAILAFGLARWLGEPFVQKFLKPKHQKMLSQWTANQSVPALLAVRLIPLISFNLINYAAGLAGIGWWRFIWTTAIGILPITILSVFVGASMSKLPGEWFIGLGLAGLALALISTFWFQRNNAKSHEHENN